MTTDPSLSRGSVPARSLQFVNPPNQDHQLFPGHWLGCTEQWKMRHTMYTIRAEPEQGDRRPSVSAHSEGKYLFHLVSATFFFCIFMPFLSDFTV